MSLLVLLGFKSANNADLFLLNPNYTQPLQASQATVSQGYTPPTPSQGLYSPGSSNPGVSPDGWVVIYVDTLPQIPPLYQPLVQLIVDQNNNNVIYNSPNIDPNTIQLSIPGTTIYQNGVPPPTDTPQTPPDNKLPFDFQPIYPDTSIQPTSDQTPNYNNLPQLPFTSQDLPSLPDLFDPNLTDLYFYPRDINPESWDYQYDNRTDIPGPQEGQYYYTPETPGDVPGLVIPVPRGFDPNMNIGKHRIPLRQPISGEGGGMSSSNTIFIANIDASGNNNAALYFSANGKNWNLASIPVANYAGLHAPRLSYGNGTFVCKFTYNVSAGPQDVAIISANGINWALAMTADIVGQGTSVITVTFFSSTNSWAMTNGSITKNFALINPPSPALTSSFISNGIVPLASAGWPAAGANSLTNTLPSGFTAVRYGFSGNSFGQFNQIDLTGDAITTTVVNSGSGWPAANWVTYFDQDPSGVSPTVTSPLFAAIYSFTAQPPGQTS